MLTRVRALQGKAPDNPGQLWRLAFSGAGSDQSLLSDVIRRFGIDLSIVHGQVDEIQGQPFGTLAVFARGAPAQLAEAAAYWQAAYLCGRRDWNLI